MGNRNLSLHLPGATVSALLLLGSLDVAKAAEGWTYTIVDETPEGSGLEFSYVSLRETGEVVYSTLQCASGCTGTIRTWADGITNTLLDEQMNSGWRAWTAHVSTTGRATFVGSCNPAASTVNEICEVTDGGVQSLQPLFTFNGGSVPWLSAGDMNSAGQTAYLTNTQVGERCSFWVDTNGSAVDAGGEFWLEACRSLPAVINEKGQAAVFVRGRRSTQSNVVQIGYFNPDLPGSGLGWIELGTDVDWVLAFEPGMNDRGLVSFVSGTLDEGGSREPTNILVGVVDIADPAKPIIDVARAGRDGVVRLHGASSINNMNEVVFVGSDTAAPFRVIWLGDVARSPLLPVIRSGDALPDGRRFLAAGRPGACPAWGCGVFTHSLNSRGQVAFIARVFDSNNRAHVAVVRADPAPGIVASNPVLPGPGDVLPDGGWAFASPCSETAWGRMPDRESPRPCFIDPPIASGYTYELVGAAPNFASVVIPTPLPGGDAEFTVEFEGFAETLKAGEYFDFTTRVGAGIRSFRITGIDLAEGLDPGDPTAFVTGLTLIDFVEAGAEYQVRMIPIVENTDDRDGDGVPDSRDNCPLVANADQADFDGDGIGDVCDNCVATANADQGDSNGNGIGDVCEVVVRMCDADMDGDIDRDDINLITLARNEPASGADDPRDADRNGLINVLDARQCSLQCDRAQCAVQ